jgi:hypothetical protein
MVSKKVKDKAWSHCDVIGRKKYCNYCKKNMRGRWGVFHRVKELLVGVKGKVTSCPIVDVGIRQEMLDSIEEFQVEKAKQQEIDDEIGRKRVLASQGYPSFEGSSTNPSPSVRHPFRYVALIHEIPTTKRSKIDGFFHLPVPPLPLALILNPPLIAIGRSNSRMLLSNTWVGVGTM